MWRDKKHTGRQVARDEGTNENEKLATRSERQYAPPPSRNGDEKLGGRQGIAGGAMCHAINQGRHFPASIHPAKLRWYTVGNHDL
mmetsp:Transcript_52893/g.158333  ORF Transcript_52893/g.158333 Transcript_52893/m.158333 type:complete len:85 (-) Transcript_52893:96-350(-)